METKYVNTVKILVEPEVLRPPRHSRLTRIDTFRDIQYDETAKIDRFLCLQNDVIPGTLWVTLVKIRR